MTSEINGAIADAIELYGVEEDMADVEFDGVIIEQDSAGGSILYVVLVSELETHKIPVTGHLHNIKQLGPMNHQGFVSRVKDLLSEYNLSKDDVDRAVKESVKIMRSEKLIK
ncbi:MAG: hypothetical protein IH631_00090 [Candidatus Thorarchaeota archaeon]|nr:hypothetical protein [Candidatus Thorarchaeota archaeon]